MTLFVETEHLLYDMHLSKSLCRLSKIVLLSPGCVDANGNVYLWGPHLRQPVTQAASEALEPKLVPGAYITFSLFIVPPSETPAYLFLPSPFSCRVQKNGLPACVQPGILSDIRERSLLAQGCAT